MFVPLALAAATVSPTAAVEAAATPAHAATATATPMQVAAVAPAAATSPATITAATTAATTATASTPSAQQDAGWTGYRVQRGDRLATIAKRYHTSVGLLVAKNGITNAHRIVAGTRILVPTTPQTAAGAGAGAGAAATPSPATRPQPATVTAKKAAPATPAGWTTYTVRRGDTLGAIARRAGTTPAALAAANHLPHARRITVGQRLAVPTAGAQPAPQKATPKKAAPTTASRPTQPGQLSAAEAKALIQQTARSRGVDPRLATAIAWQESGFKQGVVSHVGAIGIMQVMPANESWLSAMVGRPLNLRDPHDNITAGVALLGYLTSRTSSDDYAIASYYQGLGSVSRNGFYSDTAQYVRNVQALRNRV